VNSRAAPRGSLQRQWLLSSAGSKGIFLIQRCAPVVVPVRELSVAEAHKRQLGARQASVPKVRLPLQKAACPGFGSRHIAAWYLSVEQMNARKKLKGSGRASAKKQELEKIVKGLISSHAEGSSLFNGQEGNGDMSDDSIKYVIDEIWDSGVMQPLSKEELAGEEAPFLAESSVKLHNSVGQLLQDLGFAVDSEQSRRICSLVTTQWRARDKPVEEEQSKQEEESYEGEEEIPPGCCELCKRFMPLTFHHLVPKSTHKLVVKRKLFTKDEVNQRGIDICRPCHSSIHKLIDHKQMAFEYNSLEKLLEHEGVQKWIAWAEKQRTVAKDHAIRGLRYHR
jgi:hypothetical protein